MFVVNDANIRKLSYSATNLEIISYKSISYTVTY